MKTQTVRNRGKQSGFSLIIVISLMVLLSLLAVGLLTLSTVVLRSSSNGNAIAEARSNARMAMMVALGDLQKGLGPDQRVSAKYSAISGGSSNGQVNALGVWEGYHWNPEGGGSPSYSDKRDGLITWLVSNADYGSSAPDPAMPAGEVEDPVWLVDPETYNLGGTSEPNPALQASRLPIAVELPSGEERLGAMAWAVIDESQAVSVSLSEEENPPLDRKLARKAAPPRPRPDLLVDSLDFSNRPEVYEKLVSLDSAVLAAGGGTQVANEILGRQQTLSTRSIGLLTDVARGGVKQDLTTAFEASGRPVDILQRESPYFTSRDGAPSWDYIKSHYEWHESVSAAGGGQPSVVLGRRDIRPSNRGIDASPTSERLLPVVVKTQIMFSLVSHDLYNVENRVQDYRQRDPQYTHYVPNLCYDPVITLWNPYDCKLTLDKLRVRLWDPPVLFRFYKNGDPLRPEWGPMDGNGTGHGLARFQYANEANPQARKFFTFYLTQYDRRGRPGDPITLEPGEVKVFSPWIEPNWTWGDEVASGWNPRTFFDFDYGRDFGNIDPRTRNRFGIETVPGWDPRAGLQTDHLSYGARPTNTEYPFETQHGIGFGWVAFRSTVRSTGEPTPDNITVYAKPGRTIPTSGATRNDPDFRIDILAGLIDDYSQNMSQTSSRDLLRTYQFRFEDVAGETGASIPVVDGQKQIKRNFRAYDIYQSNNDPSPGGKSPFAILTMGAKTTRQQNDVAKPWVLNNPVQEGAEQDTRYVGNALDGYDVRLDEVADFNTFPGVEFDATTNRGFFGGTSDSNGGVSNVPMMHVPVIPASSLGDLIPANLVAGGGLPRITHPLGNSYASPLIPTSDVSTAPLIRGTVARFGNMLDHSYLLNDALWDSFYFSTAATFSNPLMTGDTRKERLQRFFEGEKVLLNSRLTPLITGQGEPEELADELDALPDEELVRRMATVMGVEGAFNLNCDSVEAWIAVLSSLRDEEILGWGSANLDNDEKTPFVRAGFPLAGDPDKTGENTSIDVAGAKRWAGFRALSDQQIAALAESIVDEIHARGREDQAPVTTLGEFVNRRIGNGSGLHSLTGLLQTAIDKSEINQAYHNEDSWELPRNGASVSSNAFEGAQNNALQTGHTGDGAPSILTQGDLMMALAPIATVRGDTFRIRAYGESQDTSGNTLAKAWCEATVQRIPEFLDPADPAETAVGDLSSNANRQFGRRFVVTSFRWLSPEEI